MKFFTVSLCILWLGMFLGLALTSDGGPALCTQIFLLTFAFSTAFLGIIAFNTSKS